MTHLAHQLRAEQRLFWRNREAAIFVFVFPPMLYLLLGAVYDGEVGILPNHAPFMAPLGRGTLRVTHQGGTTSFRVSGGFLQVVSNTVRVVAEQVEGETRA